MHRSVPPRWQLARAGRSVKPTHLLSQCCTVLSSGRAGDGAKPACTGAALWEEVGGRTNCGRFCSSPWGMTTLPLAFWPLRPLRQPAARHSPAPAPAAAASPWSLTRRFCADCCHEPRPHGLRLAALRCATSARAGPLPVACARRSAARPPEGAKTAAPPERA